MEKENSAEISWTPRPWGGYEVIGAMKASNESGHQIKMIYVNPGARLSLQSHQFRSELWCVVSGTAEATVGDQKRILKYGENIVVPQGTVHRLANPDESVRLVVVEVQTGSSFDENDIIRHQDDYGR
jgi:mannose-1-phosphate guanylyltransferase